MKWVPSAVRCSLGDKISPMSLTKVEQDICQFVIHRLLNQGEPTRRRALLKQFRGSLSDALRKLVDRAVLKTVDALASVKDRTTEGE